MTPVVKKCEIKHILKLNQNFIEVPYSGYDTHTKPDFRSKNSNGPFEANKKAFLPRFPKLNPTAARLLPLTRGCPP